MKLSFGTLAVFVILLAWTPRARAAMSDDRTVEPYFQMNVGVYSRDIVEKSSALTSFKVNGTADSTRVIAKAGVNIGDIVNLYLQGGGADLTIDDFDDYDASMNGAYGGGMRINLYREPYRDGLKLFVEGNYLHNSTNDKTQIARECTGLPNCPAPSNNFFPTIADETIQWNEYTFLMGGSVRYFDFGPYGGIRLSKVDGKDRVRSGPDANFTTNFTATADVKERDNFGVFFGTDVFLDRAGKTALNFEASLFDVYSFQAGIRTTF
ncbi:MAG TPA: hypothetical protein VMN77_02930 [Nitrospiria bacterium]|jgi:hypothetical protein|nr:hypothetical protein [Nitrospiria bacterium]